MDGTVDMDVWSVQRVLVVGKCGTSNTHTHMHHMSLQQTRMGDLLRMHNNQAVSPD